MRKKQHKSLGRSYWVGGSGGHISLNKLFGQKKSTLRLQKAKIKFSLTKNGPSKFKIV